MDRLVDKLSGAADRQELDKREAKLKAIEKQLADSEGEFLKRLDDLLKRKVISEAEFERANQAERERDARLEANRAELQDWLDKERDTVSLAERLPQTIGDFFEAFQTLDIRQQKAHLQSILKAA